MARIEGLKIITKRENGNPESFFCIPSHNSRNALVIVFSDYPAQPVFAVHLTMSMVSKDTHSEISGSPCVS
jgi:hypothetical protein